VGALLEYDSSSWELRRGCWSKTYCFTCTEETSNFSYVWARRAKLVSTYCICLFPITLWYSALNSYQPSQFLETVRKKLTKVYFNFVFMAAIAKGPKFTSCWAFLRVFSSDLNQSYLSLSKSFRQYPHSCFSSVLRVTRSTIFFPIAFQSSVILLILSPTIFTPWIFG